LASPQDSSTAAAGAFQATQWSLVLAASQPDSTEAREALAKLCGSYWYPVYAFIRRRGYNPEQAKDLTQELFIRLIERRRLQVADRGRGRFRSFLLACVQHLLSEERKREKAIKRGGQYSFVPLDDILAESRYGSEPADVMSPERLFERRWALTLLDQTLEQLKREYIEADKGLQFDALQLFLSGAKDADSSYAEVAVRLNLSDNAVRQAAYRMRCRFAELFRMHVAQTVAGPQELEAELAQLRAVLST
jgi:RNA polymerase sigma factor (sigma-70 family)